MTIERAVQRTVAAESDLVRDTADAIPKAWGALAARGVVTFRELAGRPPSEAERRAIWSALWDAARRTHATPSQPTCGHAIDPARHAICGVCRGMLLCLDCARAHFCTDECPARGCTAGLCVKEVRDGVVAESFGIA